MERSDNRVTGVYDWIERAISGVLLLGMMVVVLLATFSFLRTLVDVTMTERAVLDYAQFQTLFDRVLAAIIALELAHSIRQMAAGDHGLGQLRTVIVIGMLAVVRKLIVIEVDEVSGVFLLGIGGAVTALAIALAASRYVEQKRDGRTG